jgi:hypothetical protein
MPNWDAVRGMAAYGLGALGVGARAAWANPYGKAAIIGGGLGGIYGAFSDNTSVIGGMFKGAALGAGARGAYTAGRAGIGAYNISRGMGLGKGQAAWSAATGLGRGAGSLIGNTARRAYNPIKSTLKSLKTGWVDHFGSMGINI